MPPSTDPVPEDAIASPWQPTPKEALDMARDHGTLRKIEEYKFPFRQLMIEGNRRFSLKASPVADKRISNVLIPIVRMVADTCITNMSAGQPDFKVKPRKLSDYPKIQILEPAIDQVMEECNYQMEQNNFQRDGAVQGTSALEVYTQTPQRLDENGNPIRDWSRPRIGVRSRSGLEIGFDPTMRNHNHKGTYHWREVISADNFDEEYRIVTLMDGTKKYPNADKVRPGFQFFVSPDGTMLMRPAGLYQHKGYMIDHLQNPQKNFYRIYANGVQLQNIPLHKRRNRDGTHTIGDNALGETRLCVWTNNDMYDDNDQTYALYGGSEYWLMRGLDKIYNDFSNIMIDNWALSNTFALSYKPYDINIGGLDLDTTDYYSGMFIQGDLVKTSFGEANLRDFTVVKDVLDEWCIITTGANFKTMVGEQGKTAFEIAKKIQKENKRFGFKLKKQEDMVFKKLGRHIVSAIFCTMTVDDFDMVNDQDAASLAKAFADGEIGESDLIINKQGKIAGKRIKHQIHIPGIVYDEKLLPGGKRALNGTDTTLIENADMRGKGDSFVPAAEEYLVTEDYAEHGFVPDVIVDTSTMIAGQDEVALSNLAQLEQYALTRAQMAATGNPDLATNLDLKKIDDRYIDLLKFSPESVKKDEGRNLKQKEDMTRIDDQISKMQALLAQPPAKPGMPMNPMQPTSPTQPNGPTQVIPPSPVQTAPSVAPGRSPMGQGMPQ